MITGLLLLEDSMLTFTMNFTKDHAKDHTVDYTVTDALTGQQERVTECDVRAFFNALSISVHIDGTPNHVLDYPTAESIQPSNPNLRWIP